MGEDKQRDVGVEVPSPQSILLTIKVIGFHQSILSEHDKGNGRMLKTVFHAPRRRDERFPRAKSRQVLGYRSPCQFQKPPGAWRRLPKTADQWRDKGRESLELKNADSKRISDGKMIADSRSACVTFARQLADV